MAAAKAFGQVFICCCTGRLHAADSSAAATMRLLQMCGSAVAVLQAAQISSSCGAVPPAVRANTASTISHVIEMPQPRRVPQYVLGFCALSAQSINCEVDCLVPFRLIVC